MSISMSPPRPRNTRYRDTGELRECRVCHALLPWSEFYGHDTAHPHRRCKRCVRRENKTTATYRRHVRYNARGEVWCNNCQRYLHSDLFRRHPARPHTFWSYCKECTRELDRMRYRAKAKTEAGKLVTQRRTERKRQQMKREYAERREFVRKGIDILLNRGFTLSEIARTTQIALTGFYDWQNPRSKRRPTPQVCNRIGAMLRATSYLPATGRQYRRRLPHPDLPAIAEAIAGDIERNPVRSGWSSGKRERTVKV